MEIHVQKQDQSSAAAEGGIMLEVELDLDDVTQLRDQALRALEIERALPEGARTAFADAGESTYISKFIETRAVNDALEAHGIVPVAAPRVITSAGAIEAKPFTCTVSVQPRPHIGLTSIDPVDFASNRIAKPGFSQQAAREGSNDIEYLDDVKALRIALTERLDGEIPEAAMRAIGEDYEAKFERELFARGNDPETFRATHQIDEEQYTIMLTRRALGEARWNLALDAVFAESGLTISEADIAAAFENEFPGSSEQLLELHELRNDLYLTVETVRRKKALDWMLENAIR